MRKIFDTIVLLTTVLLVWACTAEEPTELPTGNIKFAIGSVADKTETRATPSELGKPLAEKFTLTIQRNGNANPVYDGKFVENMDLPVGSYSISAHYGEDVPIGRDTPYYIGTAQTEIEQGKTSSVTIPCSVGNALVSVRFGRDDEEKARFDKYYTDYGVKVKLGAYSMDITPAQEASSIYFPAGSSPQISFYGCLRNDNNRLVSFELSSESLPTTFERADHAIVTLYLPDPETSSVIDISTVEVETVTMEETIPLSWLPIPKVQPVHSYDKNGCLEGTNITFTNSYPGMTWKAEVTDAENTLYRTIEGTGELISTFAANADGWAYLPTGEYTATFYLNLNGKTSKTGSRTFTIGNPDIRVKTDCYTSYSLYRNGDVQGANACDPYTVYSPKVNVNIVSSLWQNPKYTASLATTLGGNVINASSTEASAEGTTFSFANQENTMPSLDGCNLSASVTFGKAEATGSNTVYITGLPVTFAPPTQESWSGHGTVNWSKAGEVRLGQNAFSQPQYITTERFAVPAGVTIRAPYHVLMHGATVATTLTLSIGSYNYFSERSSGGFFNNQDHNFEDVAIFTTTESVTQAKANNSYGSGQTCSYIYYLNFYYAE